MLVATRRMIQDFSEQFGRIQRRRFLFVDIYRIASVSRTSAIQNHGMLRWQPLTKEQKLLGIQQNMTQLCQSFCGHQASVGFSSCEGQQRFEI